MNGTKRPAPRVEFMIVIRLLADDSHVDPIVIEGELFGASLARGAIAPALQAVYARTMRDIVRGMGIAPPKTLIEASATLVDCTGKRNAMPVRRGWGKS